MEQKLKKLEGQDLTQLFFPLEHKPWLRKLLEALALIALPALTALGVAAITR